MTDTLASATDPRSGDLRPPEGSVAPLSWSVELASRVEPNSVNVNFWPSTVKELTTIIEDFGGIGVFTLYTSGSENMTTRVGGVDITIYLADIPQENPRRRSSLADYLAEKIEEARG